MLLGLLGGVAFALTKRLAAQSTATAPRPDRPPQPWPRLEGDPTVAAPPIARAVPDPAAPQPSERAAAQWVEPTGGVCPTTHPVKAKISSKIFHLPGMTNYERTHPDRCYTDATAAEADGLRAAKR